MSGSFPTESLQRQKRTSLLLIAASAAAIFILLELRFVPAFNDKISGTPNYMRPIATAVAHALNLKVSNSPILLAQDNQRSCSTVQGAGPGAYDNRQFYFVITYSEKAYSYCLAVYSAALPTAPPEKLTVLGPAMGENYGERLSSPVKVAPVGHSETTFSPAFLSSLLFWKNDPEKYLRTLPPGQLSPTTGVVLPGNEEVNINLLDLRPEVAKEHDLINLLLVNGVILASCSLLAMLLRLWNTYQAVRKKCLTYGYGAGWSEFLFQSAAQTVLSAQEPHYRKERESQALQQQSKAQGVLRRLHLEIRAKLERLLESPLPEQQKLRIKSSLSRDDLEEMKAVAEELESLHSQKTPEERVNALLETIKEYCAPHQFTRYQQEALEALHEKGFREAREFIVKAHAELRVQAKKS